MITAAASVPREEKIEIQSVQATSAYGSDVLSRGATAVWRRVSLIERGATLTRPWLFGSERS